MDDERFNRHGGWEKEEFFEQQETSEISAGLGLRRIALRDSASLKRITTLQVFVDRPETDIRRQLPGPADGTPTAGHDQLEIRELATRTFMVL
jgi:hypothetical protein